MSTKVFARRFMGATAMALLLPAMVWAQDEAAPAAEAEGPISAERVVVTGIRYRDRSGEIAPVLEYGQDYFQAFEPLTVGDMLKRTPSTAFLSDVLEFDGVRLRGLDPGYTQILINGKPVPGADVDRSFWVDRIPAELIERVEIIRSPSARRSGDAVAGALNIIMRDAMSFDGAFARAGALYFDDEEVKPVFGAVVSGDIGGGRGIAGVNIQGRHNPKVKRSDRFEPDTGDLIFNNREDQSDVRDGTDYSFNTELQFPIGSGELQLRGYYVLTDRTETENSTEYGDPVSLGPADIETIVPQFEDIREENFTIEAEIEQKMFGGETQLQVGFARFVDDIVTTEEESEYDPFPTLDDFGGTREFTDTTDDEWTVELTHEREIGATLVEFGVEWKEKNRDSLVAEAEISNPGDPYPAASPVDGGDTEIEETRLDYFVQLSGEVDVLELEAGLRYETTEADITDRSTGITYSNEFGILLPSIHAIANLSDDDRVSMSLARSLRRPNFDQLAPTLFEEEPTEDFDLQGNPGLDPETAWGIDVGYERRLGRAGIVGVNFFFRDVSDLIELASTGVPSSSGDGFVLEPRNVGDGKVWGVEFDLSAPLTFIGLPDTGVFLNYSWLDSEVKDPVTGTKRRFNDQAEFVFNVGFIHDIPAWGAAFGASYRKQGDAFSRIAGETVATSYGADLEAFIEKRFGESFTLRLTGTNLLDTAKDETFYKWDTVADQLSGDIDDLDEFELETEKAGPVFQLVGRMAF